MSQIDTPTDRLELPAEVCAELLSSRRRCRLLVTLAEGGEAAVVDLAAELAAAEWGTEPGAVDELERQQLRQEIFDRHLPKLTATGETPARRAGDRAGRTASTRRGVTGTRSLLVAQQGRRPTAGEIQRGRNDVDQWHDRKRRPEQRSAVPVAVGPEVPAVPVGFVGEENECQK